ncbi:uncharacterized protein LOC121781427 [Salvia splendens]|uniref:uncharacterized protein LOC121781427 n=1 Tax=Salvia splendens TaxID=180675 RepID=UPI001C27C274|nr:uncharacterized protein LOC121781427 [Salvia splendens]
MEKIRQQGPFDIFGIPLVVQPLPKKFGPDMEPEVMVSVWLRLVDLPLELLNLTAVSKIASCIGTPLSTDLSTLRRETLDGPRIQVIIDTAKRSKESLSILLPSGEFLEQKIEYEFIPKFCKACKTYGHFSDECRGRQEAGDQAQRFESFQRPRSRGGPRQQLNRPQHPAQQPRMNAPVNQSTGQVASSGGRERSRSRSRPNSSGSQRVPSTRLI